MIVPDDGCWLVLDEDLNVVASCTTIEAARAASRLLAVEEHTWTSPYFGIDRTLEYRPVGGEELKKWSDEMAEVMKNVEYEWNSWRFGI